MPCVRVRAAPCRLESLRNRRDAVSRTGTVSLDELCDARAPKTERSVCLQVVQTVKSAAMFYCATLHPEPAKENVVLAGASDKKIYQYDLNSGDMVQEYHYHLGAVNTISYIEENRMFVSTADDKTIRVWELGVPVQVKAIADPSMHSMPAAAYHPGGKFICFQSLDSQIVTYGTNGKFRVNKKKVFKGHLVGGNACQVRMHFHRGQSWSTHNACVSACRLVAS